MLFPTSPIFFFCMCVVEKLVMTRNVCLNNAISVYDMCMLFNNITLSWLVHARPGVSRSDNNLTYLVGL